MHMVFKRKWTSQCPVTHSTHLRWPKLSTAINTGVTCQSSWLHYSTSKQHHFYNGGWWAISWVAQSAGEHHGSVNAGFSPRFYSEHWQHRLEIKDQHLQLVSRKLGYYMLLILLPLLIKGLFFFSLWRDRDSNKAWTEHPVHAIKAVH